LQDYRVHADENPHAYDRIVSVGMFEHVGRRHFVEYFTAIRKLLTANGRVLVHTICKPSKQWTSAWIDKYIFPGGYIPHIDEMVDAAQSAGLVLAAPPYKHDGFHYAETLRRWRRRFEHAYPTLDQKVYNRRFKRMWRFYLAGSEGAFAGNGFYVAQAIFKNPD
jgi:cyclopropane-fatty-acyl-phospholipid synthase